MSHADGAFGGAPAGAAVAAPPATAAGDADDVTHGEKSWHYVCELAATAYPGDDPWKELHKALETATSSAPDMLNYHAFLEKVLGGATPPLPTDVGECKRAIPVIPFDLSRANALRCVTPSTLKQKAQDLTVAQQWRSYDKLGKRACCAKLACCSGGGRAAAVAGGGGGWAHAMAEIRRGLRNKR